MSTAAVIATAAFAACGHGSTPAIDARADLGIAPAIELPALVGDQPVSLASYRGRWVIVNFWSSSCVPCRTETPALEAAHQQAGDRVAFLGVDEEDVKADALDAVRRWGATYPSAYDREGALAEPWRLVGLPTTALVDPAGHVRVRHTGALTGKAIDQLVAQAAA